MVVPIVGLPLINNWTTIKNGLGGKKQKALRAANQQRLDDIYVYTFFFLHAPSEEEALGIYSAREQHLIDVPLARLREAVMRLLLEGALVRKDKKFYADVDVAPLYRPSQEELKALDVGKLLSEPKDDRCVGGCGLPSMFA